MKYLHCLLHRLSFLLVTVLWLHTQHSWALTTTKTLGQLLLGEPMTSYKAKAPVPTPRVVPTAYQNILMAMRQQGGTSVLTPSFFRRYWEARRKRPRQRIRVIARNGDGDTPFEEQSDPERDPEGVGVLGLDNHDFIVSTLDRHRTRPETPTRTHASASPPRRHPGRKSPYYIRQLTPTSKGIPGMMRSSVSVSDLRTLMQGMHDLHKAGRR